jgi:chromosome segregation ATPase
MTPVLVSVDKAGDVKIGRKKCRLYKKDEVVKVAKKYGINTEKKTVDELCGAIKARAKNSPQNTNNVPLARLYPEAARKRAAAQKKAIDKKVAANFMKGMVTKNANTAKLRQLNENKPKSAKNTQNVNKTQRPKKMNTTQIKAELKKLDSQLRTKSSQLTATKQGVRQMQQHLKTLKPYKRITSDVREFATQEYAEQLGLQGVWRFTDVSKLEMLGYHIPDETAFYKKWMNKENPGIEEARKVTEKRIDAFQAEITALEPEISELKNKVTALKTQYKNMKKTSA